MFSEKLIRNMKNGVFMDGYDAHIPVDVISILEHNHMECVEGLTIPWELFDLLRFLDPE